MDMRIVGANRLGVLAKEMKAQGTAGKGLRREMLQGLRKAGEPLKEVARKSARENLPKKGGLNEFVAASTISMSNRTTGSQVGVRLVGRKRGHDIKATDAGHFRHPVFQRGRSLGVAEKAVWVPQDITPGWWTKGLDNPEVVRAVREDLIRVLDDVARKIH